MAEAKVKSSRPVEHDDTTYAAQELIRRKLSVAGVRALQHHKGGFWLYSNGAYHRVSDDECDALLWRYLGSVVETGQSRQFQPKRHNVSNVRAALQSLCILEQDMEMPAWLENAPSDLAKLSPAEFLSVANGLLHVPSRTLHAPTPTFFSTNASNVAFELHAPAPTKWLRFLDDLWGDDVDAIRLLQEWFGYMLTSDTSLQKIMLLFGPKRAGKSTIGRVLSALVGAGNVGSINFAALGERFGLQALIGKPCCLIPDARLDPRRDRSVALERLLSISGEDVITIDIKHRDPWVGRMTTRFTILTNELPHLPDPSGAFVGRLVILKLRKTFLDQEDTQLFETLSKELPSILNWAIDGYRALYDRGGFTQTASSRDIFADMDAMSSPVRTFVEDRCVIGASHNVPKEQLYKAWRSYCLKTGNQPGTTETFGRDLKSIVPELGQSRPTVNGERVRMYTGIALADRATAGASDDPKIVRLSRTS